MMKTKLQALLLILLAACSDDPVPVVAVTGISLSSTLLAINIGETSQLSATLTPADVTDKDVSWSSSNSTVTTVDVNGLVVALTAGEATITVTSANGQHTATCDVTVTDNTHLMHANTSWDFFNPSVYSIKTNNATTLQLDLEENALWYNNGQGGLIYQMITGDFMMTATVNAVKKSNNTVSASCNVCLGGLMVRDPASTAANENYIHLVTGFTPGGLGAETKNTTASNSQYVPTAPNQLPHTDGFSQHDLRMMRSGNTFTLSKKSAADIDWVLLATFDRPDLPSVVMVGISIYTSVGGATPADLSVIYQNITITQ